MIGYVDWCVFENQPSKSYEISLIYCDGKGTELTITRENNIEIHL